MNGTALQLKKALIPVFGKKNVSVHMLGAIIGVYVNIPFVESEEAQKVAISHAEMKVNTTIESVETECPVKVFVSLSATA